MGHSVQNQKTRNDVSTGSPGGNHSHDTSTDTERVDDEIGRSNKTVKRGDCWDGEERELKGNSEAPQTMLYWYSAPNEQQPTRMVPLLCGEYRVRPRNAEKEPDSSTTNWPPHEYVPGCNPVFRTKSDYSDRCTLCCQHVRTSSIS
jgi:hypothetical protein